MSKPKTLDEAKRQARELAARGNDLRWKVSAGKLIDLDGDWVPSVRFQPVEQTERFEDGSVFEPVASYATYARNPTSKLAEARDAERAKLAADLGVSALDLMPNPVGDRNDAQFIAAQLRRGNVYVGSIEGGGTATAAPFQGRYALFINQSAHGEGSAEQVASKLVDVSRPGSVRLGNATIENPAGIPESVERYYQETLEQSPNMPTGKAWAVAWSRYCAYKRPGSSHCKMRRSEYFPGRRRGKGKRGADKIPAAQIELVHERRRGFDAIVLVRDSSGTDVWKKAQATLQHWARTVAKGKTAKVAYRVTFQDGQAIDGVVNLTQAWSQGHTLQEAVKAHTLFSAGRGAPEGWTSKSYAKAMKTAGDAEFWKALLSEYDLGDSRPHLPVRT